MKEEATVWKCIYAFIQDEDESILESIISVPYNVNEENGKTQALLEVEKHIQHYDVNKLFIVDGEKIYVQSVNKIL